MCVSLFSFLFFFSFFFFLLLHVIKIIIKVSNKVGWLLTAGVYPRCECSDDWMGRECELPCANGTAQEDFTCQCDACYAGPGCDLLCGDHGVCNNGTCTCDSGWWGKSLQFFNGCYADVKQKLSFAFSLQPNCLIFGFFFFLRSDLCLSL